MDESGNCGDGRDFESDFRLKELFAAPAYDHERRWGRGRLAVLRAASVRRGVLGTSGGMGLPKGCAGGKFILQAAKNFAVVFRQYRVSPHSPSERAHPELQPGALPQSEPAVPAG